MALDGRRLMGGHNNQPKVGVDSGRGVGEETDRGGTCRGRQPRQRLPPYRRSQQNCPLHSGLTLSRRISISLAVVGVIVVFGS